MSRGPKHRRLREALAAQSDGMVIICINHPDFGHDVSGVYAAGSPHALAAFDLAWDESHGLVDVTTVSLNVPVHAPGQDRFRELGLLPEGKEDETA